MTKVLKCPHCGNVVLVLEDKKVPMMCCGAKMVELVPNTTDAAVEKHVPVVDMNETEIKVTVGEVIHPMTPAHLISWIMLEKKSGVEIKKLSHTDEPIAKFVRSDDAVAVYEYCNLHGLWKKEL